jgi:hypothetical protein
MVFSALHGTHMVPDAHSIHSFITFGSKGFVFDLHALLRRVIASPKGSPAAYKSGISSAHMTAQNRSTA